MLSVKAARYERKLEKWHNVLELISGQFFEDKYSLIGISGNLTMRAFLTKMTMMKRRSQEGMTQRMMTMTLQRSVNKRLCCALVNNFSFRRMPIHQRPLPLLQQMRYFKFSSYSLSHQLRRVEEATYSKISGWGRQQSKDSDAWKWKSARICQKKFTFSKKMKCRGKREP